MQIQNASSIAPSPADLVATRRRLHQVGAALDRCAERFEDLNEEFSKVERRATTLRRAYAELVDTIDRGKGVAR